MRQAGRLLAIISSAGLWTSPAWAELHAPAGPWKVSYDLAQCVAMREYGTKERPLTLVLKPSPNGGVMRLLVVRKGTAQVQQMPVTLTLGSERRQTSQLDYSDDKTRFRVSAINVPMAVFKANAAMKELKWNGGFLDIDLAISALPGVIEELDRCLVDLQDYWNIGDVFKARIAKAGLPAKPLRSLFSGRDYPAVSIRANETGSVGLTFLVDETGAISDCSVDDTSGIPALDTMSCYIISKRAHFAPAMGPDGKPVRSAYSERIKWKIAP